MDCCQCEGVALRFGNPSSTWSGKLTLVDGHGGEYLMFALDNDTVWMELDRAP
jgi:hypothetical protein